MPSFCAVVDCIDKYGHGQNVPFHKFPTKNLELMAKWISFTQRSKDWQPSRWMSVCGLHFRDEDYRCLNQKKLLKKNAVPTVRSGDKVASLSKSKDITTKENIACVEDEQSSCESDEQTKFYDAAKVTCRFCGIATPYYESFAGNFEIFGVIQKCLPTLSIRQDDSMPKDICQKRCLKRLRNFASFIDMVLETQTKLQRQFRHEKSNTKPTERALKIKQEPVVRVKQENSDDVNKLFSDLVDDVEPDNDISNSESQLDQKFQFCDFPVLNDQDLINNCDIMEIINLSDPFIDITNCENTLADEEEEQHQAMQSTITNKNVMQTAHELLQAHLLIEEHNYAYAAEECKEEWQTKNFYKTEKIEAEEYEQYETYFNNCDVTEQYNQCDFDNIIDEIDAADVAAVATVETTTLPAMEVERSIKPIVTSVSCSFNENTVANFIPPATFTTTDLQQQQQQNCQPIQLPTRKRTDIVVESIVESSHTFQLQTCTICESKFIGIDSLNQHYTTVHAICPPMVTVPLENIASTIWENNHVTQHYPIPSQSCKIEKDISFGNSHRQLMETCTNTTQNSELQPVNNICKRNAKNEIKILDMQQSFLHQYNYPNIIHFEQQPTNNLSLNPAEVSTINPFPQDTQSFTTAALPPPFIKSSFIADKVTYTECEAPSAIPAPTPDVMTAKYLALQKSYHQLRLKCKRLVHKCKTKKFTKSKHRFQCRMCLLEFTTFLYLLRHRQTVHTFKRQKRRRTYFFATCPGCEKFFTHKIGLFNHMRYICQSLPLSWFKSQIRTFKCRYCRLITFTHWRLYRRHEIKCKIKCKLKQNDKLQIITSNKSTSSGKRTKTSCSKPKGTTPQSLPYACTICQKVYPTSSSLNQHRITHSNVRSFQCEICKRIFKRRNGLTQHVRGFHMKLKPFECPICNHSYALKADMKRCKHSVMNRGNKKVKKKAS